MIEENLSKRITAMKVANASRVIAILNDLLRLDPNACRSLLQFKVYCNPALLDHPSIQVSAHLDDTVTEVGIVGVLNGMLTALDIPRIASVYVGGVLVGFQLYESDLTPPSELPSASTASADSTSGNDGGGEIPPTNSDTDTNTTDGDSSANNDQPQNSDKELPLHRGSKRKAEGAGPKAKKERSKGNRDGASDARSGSSILEVGESSSPQQNTREVDPILETYKVEPSLPKPVREL